MRSIVTNTALEKAATISLCALFSFLLLICMLPVQALVMDDGLVIGEDYEYEQRGLVPLPEKELTREEIEEAEAQARSEAGVNYLMSVPLYGQCWSPWRYDQLGTCNLTICDAGCAISSTAMVGGGRAQRRQCYLQSQLQLEHCSCKPNHSQPGTRRRASFGL